MIIIENTASDVGRYSIQQKVTKKFTKSDFQNLYTSKAWSAKKETREYLRVFPTKTPFSPKQRIISNKQSLRSPTVLVE